MGKRDAKFSLSVDLFKILRSRVFLALIFGGVCILSYQFYTFTEKIRDPISGQEKIVFLKYSYGNFAFVAFIKKFT